ncbi:MAG: restriction endonuclease subunit S [Turicibacter sp.]|nr:restriction endonuclease subunit S [Turicibacter sp.]
MNKVPNLRFSSFNDGWKKIKLGDKCTFYSGGTPLTTNKKYYDGNIPFIRSAEISSTSTELNISEDGLNNSSAKIVKKGDLLYALYGATSGEVSISKIDGAINQAILCIQSDQLNLSFLEKILRKNKDNIINTYLQGGQGNLSSKIVQDLRYYFPSLEEQEKIASFFSLIDKKIELQTEKVEELKNYKKGIMQKIFSQELRFKDENGNDYPSWKEYKVKDLFDVTRGVVIAKNEISDKSNETFKYAVYSSQTSNNGILGYDQTFDFDGNYLTWTTDGANAGRVFCRSGKFRCTNVCGVLVEKDNTIGYANKLVAEILNKETPKHVSYVGNPKLMNGVMAEIKLSIPSLEEQTKIDKLINQLDIKIESEQMKLSLLVDYKKGLLQQMFI